MPCRSERGGILEAREAPLLPESNTGTGASLNTCGINLTQPDSPRQWRTGLVSGWSALVLGEKKHIAHQYWIAYLESGFDFWRGGRGTKWGGEARLGAVCACMQAYFPLHLVSVEVHFTFYRTWKLKQTLSAKALYHMHKVHLHLSLDLLNKMICWQSSAHLYLALGFCRDYLM